MAIGAFVAQGWFFAGAQIAWHEEVTVHAARLPGVVVVEDGVARVREVCDGRSPIVFTDGRPSLVLCAGGLAWPIFTTPYIGGVLYWPLQLLRPLHEGNPVSLRRIVLAVGVLTLVVVFLLVERLGDPLRAAASVLVAAALPSFVIVYSVLVLYEVVPPLLIACAALLVVRRPDAGGPLEPRRAAAAGALVGLAVLGNIKDLVVVAPLLGFALLASPALRRTSGRAWSAAALAAAVTVSPMVVAGLADPHGGFSMQFGWRTANALSRLHPASLAGEFYKMLVYAADLGFVFDVAVGGTGNLWPATLIVPGLAVGYAVLSLVRALRGADHDGVAAACGALLLPYVVFVWLAYPDRPSGNYGPMIPVFAVAMGCAIAAVGRRLAGRGRSVALGLAVAGAITVVPLIVNLYRRGDPRDAPMAFNLQAERTLGLHLRRHPGGPVVVTSNNPVGLPSAFSGQPELRLDMALAECVRQPDPEACERDVFVATADAVPGARFLVPLRTGIFDAVWERRLTTTIERAAQALGARVREEARFGTRRGIPVLALVVMEREAGRAPAGRTFS